MPRLQLFKDADATEEHRAALAALEVLRPGSPVMNVHRLLLNAPTVFAAFIGMADALRTGTKLDPQLRELAILASLQSLAARYEFQAHWQMAISLGWQEGDLAGLLGAEEVADSSGLAPAVVKFARASTQTGTVDPSTFNMVQSALGDRETVELLLNIGFYNLVARVTEPADLPDETTFAPTERCLETFLSIGRR